MSKQLRIFSAVLLLMLLGYGAYIVIQNRHIVRRAALDIGSGSIKCKVADVDTQKGKIVRIVEQMWRKADFKESIARNPLRRISPSVADDGIQILKDFVAKSRKLRAKEFAAVGTQAFAEATNGEEYFHHIRKAVGIPAVIITQSQQARLGYEAARQHYDIPEHSMVVWDIGAATVQLTSKTRNGTYLYSLGEEASVGFKNYVIREIQHLDPNQITSPNPMSPSDTTKALEHARFLADSTTSKAMKEHIHHHGGVTVVGIGPVHAISVMNQVLGKKWKPETASFPDRYTVEQVREALGRRTGMTDSAIGGDFANVQITNLILTLGYMEALGIRAVLPARINMADGLLVTGEIKEDQSKRIPSRSPAETAPAPSPAQ
mgnify:CR=1 FL=1